MPEEGVKLVVCVPETHATVVSEALTGAGRVGNYAACSFSDKAVGRFLPMRGAHPVMGEIDIFEK